MTSVSGTRELSSPFDSDPVPRRSLWAWLPFLWSQVVFAGPAPSREGTRRRSWLLLIGVPGLLLYPCLSFLLFEPDEGRYAEIPREMLARGEWITPHLQGEPYLDKPPLFYWAVMASYSLFGVHDWSARLVPALALHACVLLTYAWGTRRLGERAAFSGALALALAPGFISVGRLLVLDGLLTLWVVLGWLGALEAVMEKRLKWGWWLMSACACGLGVLTKGPVALLLLAPPLIAYRWLTGKRCRIGWKGALGFGAVVLAVCLPWYAAVCSRVPEFASYFLWRHNVLRFLTPFDHQEPIWFYGPILLGGMLPASLLLVSWIRFLCSGDPAKIEQRSPLVGYLLLTAGWCVLFFSLSGSKLPTYILPAFPPIALGLGHYIVSSGWSISRWIRPMTAAAGMILLAVHYALIPWYARFHSPMSRAAEVSRMCGDPKVPVVCYPRNCDSVAFYMNRDDFRNFRSKQTANLVQFLQEQPRTVLLFTHRHSPDSLVHALPPTMRLTDLIPVSRNWADLMRVEFCYIGVVENLAKLPTTTTLHAEGGGGHPSARLAE